MIQLVNDILQLSNLDNVSETGASPAMETVDLLDVARECVERQKVNARRSYISLTYLGESAPVTGASTGWTRAAAKPPAAPVWVWPSSSTLPASITPASSWIAP